MKKKDVLTLIRAHFDGDDKCFRDESYAIAQDFAATGDDELAQYIMALMSDALAFVPQIREDGSSFLNKVVSSGDPLPLPDAIKDDILGIVNAVSHNIGVNKFLFQGAPGTGKTEAAKVMSKLLDRTLYQVNFAAIIDSRMGQTQKNIANLFNELNSIKKPESVLILFDEIDAIALDRTNGQDIREMGRATSAMLKGLDELSNKVVIIATTNLFDHFDKALVRRFDKVVDFNRYTLDDLCDIAETLLSFYMNKFKVGGHNVNLFRKVIRRMNPVLYPGDIKNAIRSSLAFSNPDEPYDYLRRLYNNVCADASSDLKILQGQGFTLREIEMLTGVSKSQVCRDLKSYDAK
ncbi:MAG: ATP-binding protein [Clostridia bacterium]|nr:ATP-binding protein [Clostridia bacterium]